MGKIKKESEKNVAKTKGGKNKKEKKAVVDDPAALKQELEVFIKNLNKEGNLQDLMIIRDDQVPEFDDNDDDDEIIEDGEEIQPEIIQSDEVSSSSNIKEEKKKKKKKKRGESKENTNENEEPKKDTFRKVAEESDEKKADYGFLKDVKSLHRNHVLIRYFWINTVAVH